MPNVDAFLALLPKTCPEVPRAFLAAVVERQRGDFDRVAGGEIFGSVYLFLEYGLYRFRVAIFGDECYVGSGFAGGSPDLEEKAVIPLDAPGSIEQVARIVTGHWEGHMLVVKQDRTAASIQQEVGSCRSTRRPQPRL